MLRVVAWVDQGLRQSLLSIARTRRGWPNHDTVSDLAIRDHESDDAEVVWNRYERALRHIGACDEAYTNLDADLRTVVSESRRPTTATTRRYRPKHGNTVRTSPQH